MKVRFSDVSDDHNEKLISDISSAIYTAFLYAGEIFGPLAGSALSEWLGFGRASSVLALFRIFYCIFLYFFGGFH
jgi:hypothetical protein